MRDIRRIGGGRRLRRGLGKIVDGAWTTSEFSASTPTSVDDCSPERGGMMQDGGIRGGTFYGEIDRLTGSQGWVAACRSMPERERKDLGEDSPKQAGSCWFIRRS